MYTLPIVRYNFITPNTHKWVKDQKKFTYSFYNNGEFTKYLEDEDEHPVDSSRAYENFNNYLTEHTTKESPNDIHSIKTFTNDANRGLKMAKNTIIYSCVISLDEETSKWGGFGDDATKNKICEHYFEQMMKHHYFDKNDWCFFAAEHTNTPNTHLHILIYQPASVTGEKVMDYKIKANCMTSRWVQTNTVRDVVQNVKSYSDEYFQTFLQLKHNLQKSFKKEIRKENCIESLKEISTDIISKKGISGRLQYQQLIHYSKLSNNEFDKVKDKDGAISPLDSRGLINKIDSLSDFVIKSNPKLVEQMDMINKIEDKLFPIDTQDKFLNILNRISREKYQNEIKTIFGNAILNIIKERVALPIYKLSSQHRRLFKEPFKALGCREYESNVRKYIHHCLIVSDSVLSKLVQNARKAKHNELEQFISKLKESERQYQAKIERGY